MSYDSMRKLHFTEKSNIQKIQAHYDLRFNSPAAYRLRIKIGEYPAFFIVTMDLLNLISDLYKLNADLKLLLSQLPTVAVSSYTRMILVEEIHQTNEIENVHSTRKEIETSLEHVESKTEKHENIRFAGMIEKYRRLRWEEPVELSSCQDIRSLYNELVLPEVIREKPENQPDGEIFREGPVAVRNPHDKILHEGLYPESEIIQAMDAALAFLHDDSCHPLIRIAVFHFLFAYIHPFYDGNGRMTRFISSDLLSKELSPLVGLRLSYVIKEKRSAYYRMFQDTNVRYNMGDLTEFIFDFLTFVRDDLQEICDYLNESALELKKYIDLLENYFKNAENAPKDYSALWILVQNELFSTQSLGMPELLQYVDKSRSTIQKELNVYRDEWHVLTQEKDGRKLIYHLDLNKLLTILENHNQR